MFRGGAVARLRRDIRPNGLRQRLAQRLIDKYSPASEHRHQWEDDLMWHVYAKRRVDALLAGDPVDMYAWELPSDARMPFHTNDRVRLVGEDLELIVRRGVSG